ncbi:cerevisin [Nematocida sp. AWRm80]|nr:cerevisin [Nematocida sp. AWRm80]
MLWIPILVHFALVSECKKYIVLLKDNLSESSVQEHSKWLYSNGVYHQDMKGFSVNTLQGYSAEMNSDTASALRNRPDVLAVEENQEYQIQVYNGASLLNRSSNASERVFTCKTTSKKHSPKGLKRIFPSGAQTKRVSIDKRERQKNTSMYSPYLKSINTPSTIIVGEFTGASPDGLLNALLESVQNELDDTAYLYSEPIGLMHNILKGRRHFRKNPVKKIFRRSPGKWTSRKQLALRLWPQMHSNKILPLAIHAHSQQSPQVIHKKQSIPQTRAQTKVSQGTKSQKNTKSSSATMIKKTNIFSKNKLSSQSTETPTPICSTCEIKDSAQANSILEKMHYPAYTQNISIQGTVPWGLSRLSQRGEVYTLSNYIYPTSAGSGVTVYVLDTGIESTHPELDGKVLPGINVIDGTLNAEDDNGHGTHCAGIIGGRSVGVAKKTSLVPVKILSAEGRGTTESTVLGLVYVMKEHHRKLKETKHPKTVVNMSLGGVKSSVLKEIAKRAISMGISIVVAGGNNASNACEFSPSSIHEVITVGAIDQADEIAHFSNTGSCVDLYAPGVKILSSHLNGVQKELTGTSMAAPHVAGLAALYLGEGYHSPSDLRLLIKTDSFSSGSIKIASSKILNLRLQ